MDRLLSWSNKQATERKLDGSLRRNNAAVFAATIVELAKIVAWLAALGVSAVCLMVVVVSHGHEERLAILSAPFWDH